VTGTPKANRTLTTRVRHLVDNPTPFMDDKLTPYQLRLVGVVTTRLKGLSQPLVWKTEDHVTFEEAVEVG
jgi:hypothetical protein